jgi:hypothetical protein
LFEREAWGLDIPLHRLCMILDADVRCVSSAQALSTRALWSQVRKGDILSILLWVPGELLAVVGGSTRHVRLSGLAALVGSLLHLRLVTELDKEGHKYI